MEHGGHQPENTLEVMGHGGHQPKNTLEVMRHGGHQPKNTLGIILIWHGGICWNVWVGVLLALSSPMRCLVNVLHARWRSPCLMIPNVFGGGVLHNPILPMCVDWCPACPTTPNCDFGLASSMSHYVEWASWVGVLHVPLLPICF